MKSTQDSRVYDGLIIKRMKPEHILLLDSKVQKQFISFDDQYLHRCLEFIQRSADNNVLNQRKNMLDILSSPLFNQLGSTVCDRASLLDLRRPKCTSILNCGGLDSTKYRLEKDRAAHKHGFDHVYKSSGPLSNTVANGADHSSSSVLAPTACHWMLHNKGNCQFPHYVFSCDGQRDFYVASLLKVDSANDKVDEYIYTIHSGAGDKMADQSHDQELNLVGKMKVSTSITINSDGAEVKETHFVLFGFSDIRVHERQTRSHELEKSKALSRKMSDILKATRTFKHKSSMEHSVYSSHLEDQFSQNHELAAVVVKEQIYRSDKNPDIGGWGLKFLNKTVHRQANEYPETEVLQSNYHSSNEADCSTSIDIIIPAGLHGVPRAKNRAPSSLIGRWISGGKCDCSGWDMGCTLTLFKTKHTEPLSQAKAFDIFAKGSKTDSPALKMINVGDDLYRISFCSTLSALQSFSIAVTILHTRTHRLTVSPNYYHKT